MASSPREQANFDARRNPMAIQIEPLMPTSLDLEQCKGDATAGASIPVGFGEDGLAPPGELRQVTGSLQGDAPWEQTKSKASGQIRALRGQGSRSAGAAIRSCWRRRHSSTSRGAPPR
jgi:hypothetical protein